MEIWSPRVGRSRVSIPGAGHTGAVDLIERGGAGSTRHPWEIARAEFFLQLLGRHDLLDRRTWLDVGAGDGWFAAQLRQLLPEAATIMCWDINYTQEDLDELADVVGITFVAERPAGRFETILMLDVVEHAEDDAALVGSVVSDLLDDGGSVLVSVPAYESLYSAHDRALRHRRRYSPAQCRGLLEQAGLRVVASGGLFLSLLPPRAVQVLAERARSRRLKPRHGVAEWRRGRVFTRAATRALRLDARLSLRLSERGVALPGLSYWALCRLPRT